ncbi:PIN domain-containing protein [Nakamurella leprariae]|uniref:PIN domain-containing protein n=1 Tax=Nakamurella leprariae TaxID=2803911 RepID=A0A938YID2_9ACTN|nr:hypothetical protein [Nakamurella leprariae]MBM9468877.1 hypothetical protein [Nakamurella leprariae]
MSVLIDSNVLVNGLVVEGASISILTLFELASGINGAVDPVERAARQRRFDASVAVFDPFPVSRRVLEVRAP